MHLSRPLLNIAGTHLATNSINQEKRTPDPRIFMWQLLVVLGCSGTRRVMAIEHYNPYVSEFEYASRFHPSKNPNCPAGEFDNLGEREEGKNPQDFQSSRYERSQEERPPVREEPSIEVRAILVRCPKSEKTK